MTETWLRGDGWMRDYELLKKAGHDPAKAAEILLDVKRGDAHAIRWLAAVMRLERE